MHNASDQFECYRCHKLFKLKSSLQRHQLHSHQNFKEHKCTKCSASFAQRTNLQAHQNRLHSRITNFKCLECDFSYLKNSSALKRHIKAQHFEKSEYPATLSNLVDDPNSLAKLVVTQLKSLEQGISDAQLPATGDNKNTVQEHTIFVDQAIFGETNLRVQLNPEKKSIIIKVQTIKRQNERLSYVCEHCAKEFHKTYNLIRHLRSHTKERPYDCSVCSSNFKTKTSLELHFKRMHRLNKESGLIDHQHKCYICLMNFSSLRKLDYHLKSHLGSYDMQYYCNVCQQKFNSKISFSSHTHKDDDKELVELEQLLPEPIALKTSQKTLQIKHFNTTKKFNCKSCDSTYMSSLSLRVHEKLHIKEGIFPCSLCVSRKFTTKYQLERHKRYVHSAERNYQCQCCDGQFKSKTLSKSHMRSVHLKKLLGPTLESTAQNIESPTAKNFVEKSGADSSDTSVAKFIRIELLPKYSKYKNTNIQVKKLAKASFDNVAPKTILLKHKCSNCKKIFQKPSDLLRHNRLHTKERPFVCNICQKSFTLQSTLKDHHKTHLDKLERCKLNVACQVCGKFYATQKSLNVHYRLHTGGFPFQCEFCGKSFRTSGYRLAHLKAAKHKNGNCSKINNIFQDK